MKERKKQVISVRMEVSDIRRTKLLADRLLASESDVLRFALRQLLKNLSALCNSASGAQLLPMFMNYGTDLVEHFHFDRPQLERIFNENAHDSDHALSDEAISLVSSLSQIGALSNRNAGQESINDVLQALRRKAYAHGLITDQEFDELVNQPADQQIGRK